jgi:hypothetical protein
MKIPAISDMFKQTIKSPINIEYLSTSNVTEISSDYLSKIKSDLIPDIPSFDNIKNLPNAALETLATSIGINKNTFTKIMDISDKLNLSSLIDGDVNAVKAALLEQLELKNLVQDALNPDVLKMLAESVGISEKNLENMLKTSYQIKTFSDIKNMEMYKLLDSIFKKKLIEDNGLSDTIQSFNETGTDVGSDSEKFLENIVYISTLLYSKDESDRKKAEEEAKKLQTNFLLLFKNSNSEPEILDRPSKDMVSTPSPWLENFSKIDYRVQKIAALAMGFGLEEDAVLQLRDTIEMLNAYKKLDDEVQQKKDGLMDHLTNLDNLTTRNSSAIDEYKEENGLSDVQFDNACKIVFSDEMQPKDPLLDPSLCTEGYDPDVIENKDELFQDPLFQIGLNPNLAIRDETTNEIIGYNGDVIFSNNRDQITGKLYTEKIPFKFKKVYGNFICKDMKLKDLTNSPDFVQGNFDCSLNELTALTGAPKQVDGNFNASYNFLQTIEGLPTSVGGNIDLKNNDLENLDISYSVTLVNNGDFIVSDNFLANLQSGDITGIGTLDVSDNKLRNTTLVNNCLLRIKKGIIANNQISGTVDIKILRDKFGSDLSYEV